MPRCHTCHAVTHATLSHMPRSHTAKVTVLVRVDGAEYGIHPPCELWDVHCGHRATPHEGVEGLGQGGIVVWVGVGCDGRRLRVRVRVMIRIRIRGTVLIALTPNPTDSTRAHWHHITPHGAAPSDCGGPHDPNTLTVTTPDHYLQSGAGADLPATVAVLSPY